MIEDAIKTYVDPGAASLIASLHMVAVAGIGLYFTLTGYLVMMGEVEESFYHFLKQCLKVIFIAAFALNVDNYSHWVVESLKGLESGLSAAMSVHGVEPDASTYKILDKSISKGFDLVGICMEKADKSGWAIGTALGWLIAGFIIGVCSIIITIVGGATIIATKFSLAVMFALGPLFIMCLMWPVTEKFFDSWFSQIANYIFTVVIMIIVMSFAISCYESFITIKNIDTKNPFLISLKILAVTLIFMWLIKQVGEMASSLAGGFSSAALTIKDLAKGAITPYTEVKEFTDSTRDFTHSEIRQFNFKTGERTESKHSHHFKTDNMITNPLYRQKLIENIGRNWGRK